MIKKLPIRGRIIVSNGTSRADPRQKRTGRPGFESSHFCLPVEPSTSYHLHYRLGLLHGLAIGRWSGIFLQPTKLKNGFFGVLILLLPRYGWGRYGFHQDLTYVWRRHIDLEMKVNTQALNFPFYPSIKIIEKHIKSTKGEVSEVRDWKNCRL